MEVYPDVGQFSANYDSGQPQVVWTTLVADLETPVSAMLKLASGRANRFLLESVEGGDVRGRYSFIGLDPDLIWRCRGNSSEINRQAISNMETFEACPEPVLDSLRHVIRDSHISLPTTLPPMAAGLVGYMAYDMVRLMERLPDVNRDSLGLPDGLFLRPTIMVIFDNIEHAITIVTTVRPVTEAAGTSAGAAYERASARLADAVAKIERPLPYNCGESSPTDPPEPKSNMTREAYFDMVARAKEYIAAGDIFQVVLSQRFATPFMLPAFSLYRALRRLNPSPFLFFLDFGGFSVVGSSPEILVRLRDGKVTIRPIAGTRRRGKSAEEDTALAAELLADPKEQAEHLMLLDLGRNDVGRVAQIGTVSVTEKMVIECYSHVMHIVSNVEGTIDPVHDAMAALAAGFPAGTVSGAPKVRAMEIIEELEPDRRGIYGGCVGYFSADGGMDTCITLRTAVVKDGTMYIQAGGGIVADSDPEGEYQESCNKARALIRATEEAVRFAAAPKR